MEKMKRAFNLILNRQTIELSKQMNGMVSHSDKNVWRVITLCRQAKYTDGLTFTNEQVTVISRASFGQPCGIQSDNSQSSFFDADTRNIREPVRSRRSVLIHKE